MAYSYDRRMVQASDDEEDADKLTEWQGLVLDAVNAAQAVVQELDKSTDSDALDEPLKHGKELVSDLSSAETCETTRDYLANIRAARASVGKLDTALKLAKKSAKKERDEDALRAIENATDDLSTVKRELHDIENEIHD